MNKRHAHNLYRHFRAAKPSYFLIVAVISLAIGIVALRANNEHMIKLRDAVYTADKNNDNVEVALHNLQSYVTGHMNTNLSGGNTGVYPPVQLKYTYDRLVQAESEALAQSNSALYTAAQAYCEAQRPTGYVINRIGCVEDYLTSHDTLHQLVPIPDALYKFSFISPTWSPDLAGWSLVTAAFSGVLFVISLGVKLISKK